jgi:hypothetical protein
VKLGAGQPVEAVDRGLIAWAKLIEHAAQFGPIPLRAGCLLSIDIPVIDPGLDQGIELQGPVLVRG